MTLDDRIVRAALDVGLGRSYGHTGDATQDCVRLWYAILCLVYIGAGLEQHSDEMHLHGYPLGSFANAEAIVDLGLGEYVDTPQAGRWHYCQGWRHSGSGHCWGWYEPPAVEIGSSMVLEATTRTTDWYAPEFWADRRRRFDEVRIVALREEA